MNASLELANERHFNFSKIISAIQKNHWQKKASKTSPRVCIIHNVNHFQTKVTTLSKKQLAMSSASTDAYAWRRSEFHSYSKLISLNIGWFSPRISPKMLPSFHEFRWSMFEKYNTQKHNRKNQHTRELISVRNTSAAQVQLQQQRPESPTVTLTWHACKYKVHKHHQR